MISTKVRNLIVVQCNKYGEEVQGLTSKEATLIPAANFNLCSLTERQKEGWNIHGDDRPIWLTKGSSKVMFDIMINTPRGELFCFVILLLANSC